MSTAHKDVAIEMALGIQDLKKSTDTDRAESVNESTAQTTKMSLIHKLLTLGVELRGIVPVTLEERADTTGINLLSPYIATGMAGTLSYRLSLKVCTLSITLFALVSAIPVAWMGLLGPKTGMRQIIQARYSFGYYLIAVVIMLQLATLTGYTIITAIFSEQTLSAISGGSLSLTVGIVLTALIGLVVSFMGYRVLPLYEKWSWIPTFIAIIIAVGYGAKSLAMQSETEAPTVRSIFSFGSIIISFIISWAPLVSDFAVYVSPEVPRLRVFFYVYVGLYTPSVLLLILGAAIAGGYGKFVAVMLAFSVLGNMACSLYSISINFQIILPFFARVPRYIWSIVITDIVIPVSIVVAANFLGSLGNFLGVIGYWAAVFIGILLTEFHYFRNGNPDSFDSEAWNTGSKLPIGVAALTAGVLCFALIIPSMDAVWYSGPIAQTTGDLGVEFGFLHDIFH